MRVPVSWLREYVRIEAPVQEIADRLVISTCEVDGIETVGVADVDGNLGLFRVGRVLDATKHPNADRLQLCQVDVGEGDPRQIVCGAWNFGVGATVGVALPGAVLPNGLELERRKVRGELSDGMILAEDEVVAVTRRENEDALRAVLTAPAPVAVPGSGDPGYGGSGPSGPYEPSGRS